MSLENYAKRELDMLLNGEDDEMQIMMNNQILEIIKLFADQGHSNFSAKYAIKIIERLMRWKPIKPLTGEDDEWNECGDNCWQNKRCSSVFKENGVTHDIDEYVVSDDGGHTWFYSNILPNTPIHFPYIPPEEPKKVYIEQFENGHFDIITGDLARIKELYDLNSKK